MIKTSLFALCVLLVGGCANMTESIYRDLKVDDGVGAMVDIKQRAVMASKRTGKTIVCAEPSPDALSALAAEFSAKADTPGKTSAALAAAFQESAAFVGVRTQSIQLLRDTMYRMCEAYLSGGIDERQYELLMRRFQKDMVALLAVEQLIGAIHAPPVTISTQGQAEAARSLSLIGDEIKKTEAKIADLDVQIGKLEFDKSSADDAKKQTLQADIDKLKADKTALQSDKVALEKSRTDTRDLVASGSATATVNVALATSNRSDEHIQAVSKTVERIAMRVLDIDDMGVLCWAKLSEKDARKAESGKTSGQNSNTAQTDPLITACENYFTSAAESSANVNKLVQTYADVQSHMLTELKSVKPNQEKIRQLRTILDGIDEKLGNVTVAAPGGPVIQQKSGILEQR